MLNSDVGSPIEHEGRRGILTHRGVDGHALFGPYERYAPGRYLVAFTVAVPDDEELPADAVWGRVDVVTHQGGRSFADAYVTGADVRDGRVILPFVINEEHELEFRIHVSGRTRLIVMDHTVVRPDDGHGPRLRALPALVANRTTKQVYDNQGEIIVDGDRLLMTLHGIRFGGQTDDDVNFVDELFFKSAYNFKTRRPTCVIDVGMNVGLASLLFAANGQVAEVHAFEPFAATYRRALANLALNPVLATKIRAHNIGLSDAEEDVTLTINENHGDSGGMQTRSVEGGTPMRLAMRDAAGIFRPLIDDADARGLDVVVKIDCEGAEFPIFASLAAAGLFARISALMVEWHRIFDGRTQDELIEPLLAAGFTVFDVTPPDGNGFFYAARTGHA